MLIKLSFLNKYFKFKFWIYSFDKSNELNQFNQNLKILIKLLYAQSVDVYAYKNSKLKIVSNGYEMTLHWVWIEKSVIISL